MKEKKNKWFNLFSGITEILPSSHQNIELLALRKINSAARLLCSKCSTLCRQMRSSSLL